MIAFLLETLTLQLRLFSVALVNGARRGRMRSHALFPFAVARFVLCERTEQTAVRVEMFGTLDAEHKLRFTSGDFHRRTLRKMARSTQ